MNHGAKTTNATYSAALCDQFWADGLRAAFVAPGSRSTPLALALLEHPGLAVEVFHDERSASFAALGYALATGVPGLVLCSSGTAGAHFYAAAIEADASMVPMIICTADRPPELWGRGAPQTINQTHLYGKVVRKFLEPGPPDDLEPSSWRKIARSLWASATGTRPGPVHANLSFRDPLTGIPGTLPAPLEPLGPAPLATPDGTMVQAVLAHIETKRGVLIVGRSETTASDLTQLAMRLGWPIIADHRSGCRDSDAAVHHFDALLREPAFADSHYPQVVLRIGEIVASKSTSQWLSRCDAHVIASRPQGRNIDPEDIARLQFDEAGFVAALLAAAEAKDIACDPAWAAGWSAADQLAADAMTTRSGAADSAVEESLAVAVVAHAPADAALVLSSSMPVRDVEWYARGSTDLQVIANRGANGIDGIVATAIGVALTGKPTACLIGDVAFLHDSSSLVALRNRDIDLTIFVIDNDGGGIFSFLPQHELLDTEVFEKLFGTPHGTDFVALAAAHRLPLRTWDPETEPSPYWPDHRGPRIVLVRSNRADNVASHNANVAAAGRALRDLFGS